MKHAPASTKPQKPKRCTHKTRTTSWERKCDGRRFAAGSEGDIRATNGRNDLSGSHWMRKIMISEQRVVESVNESHEECSGSPIMEP
jgi:hypothetical protein